MYCVEYRVCTVLTDARYTIRYSHVWTQCVTVCQSSHTVHMMNMKWGRIYRVRAILLSRTVSSRCNIKKLRIYFCQATFMALYPRQKTRLQYRASAPTVLYSVLRFLISLSQVAQCVQSDKNTLVQWFPTRGTGGSLLLQLQGERLYSSWSNLSCTLGVCCDWECVKC